MTAIVGLLCKTGVIIGADSSTTFTAGQIRTIEQPTQKLDVIGGSVILAGTGQVGLGQRFSAIIQKAYDDNTFSKTPVEVGKYLSRLALDDFRSTYVQPNQLVLNRFSFEGQKLFM